MSFTSDYHRGYLAGIAEGERAATERIADDLDALADSKRNLGFGDYVWKPEARTALKYAAKHVRRGMHNETETER